MFTRERPTHWSPRSVTNPESGLPFTDAGAWEFIASCLDGGCPLHEVALETPAGKTGYVMEIEVADRASLYVKLQLGDGGKVIGRSFHLSTKESHE